ncbi:alpha/beta fold hydrolase [Streptomyces europaeiscabiei]|uniref:alpha/beta fold hydrolase n=1 Tax=Streptomyces europaeiscabiei TaxID=146819 RepID=UPI0029CAA1C2|nr:alpha/beta fold hydrolase [Streptomyces europaeiscabiei]
MPVLFHGWPQASYCWRPMLADLAVDCTVVAPDLRGYGLSDKPTTGYDKRRMAADMAGFVSVDADAMRATNRPSVLSTASMLWAATRADTPVSKLVFLTSGVLLLVYCGCC